MKFEQIQKVADAKDSPEEREKIISYDELVKAYDNGSYGHIFDVAIATNDFEGYKQREELQRFKKDAAIILKQKLERARADYKAEIRANPNASQDQSREILYNHLNIYTDVGNMLNASAVYDVDLKSLVELHKKPIDEA